MDKNKKNMSPVRQSLYTFLLIITCLIASPFMYAKIWKSSAEKGKPQNIPTASANTVTTIPQIGGTELPGDRSRSGDKYGGNYFPGRGTGAGDRTRNRSRRGKSSRIYGKRS